MNERSVSSGTPGPSTPGQSTSVTTAAQSVATKVKDVAEGVATSQFASFSAEQKEKATGTLDGFAVALRHTGSKLREQDQGMFANYLERAGRQVENLSNHLDEKNFGELIQEVEGYARREPAIFLGGAFVLGLLGARFLKSSSRPAPGPSFRPSRFESSPQGSVQARRDVTLAGAEGTTGVMYGSGSGASSNFPKTTPPMGGSTRSENASTPPLPPPQAFNKGRD